MECNIKELFKKYKGQPIQVITESGMRYCGILVSDEDETIDIIDAKGRTVRIEIDKIEAIIEPRMKLKRLCKDNDCCCEDEDDDEERDYNDEEDDCEDDCDDENDCDDDDKH